MTVNQHDQKDDDIQQQTEQMEWEADPIETQQQKNQTKTNKNSK